MTTRTHKLLIALASAGITAAFAQAPAAGSTLPPNLVAEPTASMSRADGPGADVGKQLTDAINADQSLKGSKITVQPEEGKITLSGVTERRDQAKRVGQMAAQAVGVENVTNAIRDSEATVEQNPAPQQELGREQQVQPEPNGERPAQTTS